MIPDFNLVVALVFFGILQSILIITFILLKSDYYKHRYFFGLASVGFLLQIDSFLQESGYMIHSLHLLNTAAPLVFLLGPFILFYTQSSIGKKLSFKNTWFHYLPFVTYLSYSFFFFLVPWERKYNAYITQFDPSQDLIPLNQHYVTDPLHLQGWIVVEGMVLHLLIYSLIGIFIAIKRTQTLELKRWLSFLNCMMIIGAIILFMAEGGIVNGKDFFPRLLPSYGSRLFGTLFTYGVTAFLLRNVVITQEGKRKYYNSTLKKELKTRKLEILKQQMKENRVFLDPEFSREKLAKLTNISPNHLSQILNEELGLNFFEWVHQYRIEEATKRLSDPNRKDKMEILAYELGYKSKSTFFTTFKKQMGMTPLQYRKERLMVG